MLSNKIVIRNFSGLRGIQLTILCLLVWLLAARPAEIRAQEPACYDPQTKKQIPCTATPEGGGDGQPETNGRMCLSAFDDLNFNGAQDPGEPWLGGGQVKIVHAATGALTLVDLMADGPYCQFLPGGADYHGQETPPSGFSIIGSDSFDAHLDAGGTVNVVFANSVGKPSPTAPPNVPFVITPSPTPSATASPTPTATATATHTATASSTPTPTSTPAPAIIGAAGAQAQSTRPPAPAQPAPSRVPACPPWFITSTFGVILTALGAGLLAARLIRPGPGPSATLTDRLGPSGPGITLQFDTYEERVRVRDSYDSLIRQLEREAGRRPRPLSARVLSMLGGGLMLIGGLETGLGAFAGLGFLPCRWWPAGVGSAVIAGLAALGLLATLILNRLRLPAASANPVPGSNILGNVPVLNRSDPFDDKDSESVYSTFVRVGSVDDELETRGGSGLYSADELE